MGVVHKLRKEVINFIVNQKKKNPELSCRALTDLAVETFEIKLSKSSVNNILKNSNLSSKVGRRSQEKNEQKKFTIPSQKKTLLFKNVQKEKTGAATSSIKESSESAEFNKNVSVTTASMKKPAKVKMDLKETIKRLNEKAIEKSPVSQKKSTPSMRVNRIRKTDSEENDISKNFSEGISITAKKDLPFQKGAGLVIFKSLLRELSKESVLGCLFKEFFCNEFLSIPLTAFDLCFIQYLVGEKMIEEILNDPKHAVWTLFEFSHIAQFINFFHKTQNVYIEGDNAWEAFHRIEQCFIYVYAFELFFSDGSRIYIDAEFKQISSNYPLTAQGIPLNKAMGALSEYIISNNETVTIKQCLVSKQDSEILNRFLQWIDIGEIQIEKIKLLTENQKTLTSFSTIPNHFRSYSVGLYPGSELYQRLCQQEFVLSGRTNDLMGIKDDFCEEILGKKGYYRRALNTFIKGKEGKSFTFDCFFVFLSSLESPDFVILTNEKNRLEEEIVLDYLKKYSYNIEKETANNNIIRKNINSQKNNNSLDLEKFSQKRLFVLFETKFEEYFKMRLEGMEEELDIKSFIRMLYSEDAQIVEKEKYLLIYFLSNENFQKDSNAMKIFQKINEGCFSDEKDRKIYVKWGSL